MMLRWPGGKRKSARYLLSLAQRWGWTPKEVRDPFCGGNGFFLELPPGIDVWLNDKSEWVAWFWRWFLFASESEVVNRIMERTTLCLPMTEDQARAYFTRCKVRIRQKYDPIDYLTLNLWAVNAIVSPLRKDIASFSPLLKRNAFEHVSEAKILRYRRAPVNVRAVTVGDYSRLLWTPGKDVLLLIDPPYVSTKPWRIYPGGDFTYEDFLLLESRLSRCDHRWLVTSGHARWVKGLFRRYEMLHNLYVGSMTHRPKERREDKLKTELVFLSHGDRGPR